MKITVSDLTAVRIRRPAENMGGRSLTFERGGARVEVSVPEGLDLTLEDVRSVVADGEVEWVHQPPASTITTEKPRGNG